jgi:hypothetical protein
MKTIFVPASISSNDRAVEHLLTGASVAPWY